MKILVTGAAGFIGYFTAVKLLERGDTVVGLDNFNDYYDVSLKEARAKRLDSYDNFSMRRIDLADRSAMEKLFANESFQKVVHLGAQAGVRYSIDNPHAYIDSNIVGTLHILEGCRHHGIEHLVFASSSSVYGANTSMPYSIHHNVDHPLALYGATKKSNELMAHSRDFTYIDDIVEGVVRSLDNTAAANEQWDAASPDPASSKAPYRIYNIGNQKPVELMRFIELIEENVGKKAQMNMLPMQAGDVPDTWADASDLADAVGYAPNTSIEVGVKQFVEWYLAYYKDKP